MSGHDGVTSPFDLPRTDLTFEQVVPGLAYLPGPVDWKVMPSMFQHTIGRKLPQSWREVSEMRVGEVLAFRNVGAGKVIAFVEYLRGLTEKPLASVSSEYRKNDAALARGTLWLRDVIAGATEAGLPDLVSALEWAVQDGSPLDPRGLLEGVVLHQFGSQDWLYAINQARTGMSERSLQVLDGRVFTEGGKRATLDALGETYGVTRERVRQIEGKSTERFEASAAVKDSLALRHARKRVRSLGATFPLSEVGLSEPSPERATLLWLTGPFVVDRGWAVLDPHRTVADVAKTAFRSVDDNGIASRIDFEGALIDHGVKPQFVAAVAGSVDLEEIGDTLVLPASSAGDRAVQRLTVHGRPLSVDELMVDEAKTTNRGTFANAIRSHEGIKRVGKERYGLRRWTGEEYEGIVPAMVDRLDRAGSDGLIVVELARELSEEYGVSEASVHMYATMHPLFLASAGMVRLRPPDVPYQPKVDMENSAGCFVVGGFWSLRIRVDRELIRGSGRLINEAFGVHLGGWPGRTGRVHGPSGEIHVGWQMGPSIGSLRRDVERLGLTEGDFMFMRRTSPTTVDFIGVRQASIEAAPPDLRINALLGRSPGDLRDWRLILAESLGIGAATEPNVKQLLSRLSDRGEHDLIEAVEEAIGAER